MIRALEGFYASCMSGHSDKEGFYGGDLKGLNIPVGELNILDLSLNEVPSLLPAILSATCLTPTKPP